MHRNGSGSTASRHQFLADMLEVKVSWLLCIDRLVSKHRKVMYWCSYTGQWARLKCTGDDFVILLLHRGLTWCIIQHGLAPSETAFGHLGSPCQSWSNVRMVCTVRFWRFFVWGPWWLGRRYFKPELARVDHLMMAWMMARGNLGDSSCMWWRPHVISTCLDHLLRGV